MMTLKHEKNQISVTLAMVRVIVIAPKEENTCVLGAIGDCKPP
jgi:hypothetical protein